MYQELLNVRYQHEYFEGSKLLDLHCELSPSAHKLCDAMDAVIIPSLGGLKLLWNDQRHNKEELIDLFSRENLLLYFYPKESDLFFSVTSNLESIHKYKTLTDREGKTISVEKRCPCFYAFQWLNASNTQLQGVSEPADKLLFVPELSELKKLKDINLNKNNKPVKIDADIKQLLALTHRRPIIVLNIPMANFLKPGFTKAVSLNMNFEAQSVVYKYYFLGLKPDKNLKIINELDDEKTANSAITYSAHEESIDGENLVPIFISDNPIKLKDRPSEHYKLVRYKTDGSTNIETIVAPLPHPKPTQYFKHKQEGSSTMTVLEAFIN